MCDSQRPLNGADSLPFDEPPGEPWDDELATWENDRDAQPVATHDED